MKTAGEKEVTLKFNGEDVSLAPFIENMLKNLVIAMASALKGYKEGMDITVEIK